LGFVLGGPGAFGIFFGQAMRAPISLLFSLVRDSIRRFAHAVYRLLRRGSADVVDVIFRQPHAAARGI
jgi:hypothetical protein